MSFLEPPLEHELESGKPDMKHFYAWFDKLLIHSKVDMDKKLEKSNIDDKSKPCHHDIKIEDF